MAGAHFVICKYCNVRFNRDKEPFVDVGSRRYAHKACAQNYQSGLSQEEQDYNELEKYIRKLFNIKVVSAKIKKQIKDFRAEYGYSYTGIQKTLFYWFEIRKQPLDKANNGIGIVPYVYKDAEQYYYRLYLAQVANSIENIINYHTKVEEIEIESPRVRVSPPKLFNFEDN